VGGIVCIVQSGWSSRVVIDFVQLNWHDSPQDSEFSIFIIRHKILAWQWKTNVAMIRMRNQRYSTQVNENRRGIHWKFPSVCIVADQHGHSTETQLPNAAPYTPGSNPGQCAIRGDRSIQYR
jgi:hypothetical protein